MQSTNELISRNEKHPLFSKKFAFVDIETTGLHSQKDSIIEIGIIRVENGCVVEKFETLIKPSGTLSPFITTLTGITPPELMDAPSFSDVSEKIATILSDCLFVAHNARFDYGFLKQHFDRCGMSFRMKQLCTVKLFRLLFPSLAHHHLDSLITHFSLSVENRHRAFSDAWVLWEFFQKITTQFSSEEIASSIQQLLKTQHIPKGLSEQMVSLLPEKPGVYIFYDQAHTPLYIGKSTNIKKRVLSHFSADYRQRKEMRLSDQVRAIDTIETPGELGALLEESRLIKELCPLYNVQLRKRQKIWSVYVQQDTTGYLRLQTRLCEQIAEQEKDHIVGIFRSQYKAEEFLTRLRKTSQLCAKLMGIEKGKGACFQYHLQGCLGACIGEEDVGTYNARVQAIQAAQKIKPWPFQQAVLIEETDAKMRKTESFVIDEWKLQGKMVSNEHGSVWVGSETKDQFDVDTYKIILRYLYDPAKKKMIKKLPSSFSVDQFALSY